MGKYRTTLLEAKKQVIDTIENYKVKNVGNCEEFYTSRGEGIFSQEIITFSINQCKLYDRAYSAALKYSKYTDLLLECENAGVNYDKILENPNYAANYVGNVCLEYGKPWNDAFVEMREIEAERKTMISEVSLFCKNAVGVDSEYCAILG